MYKRIALAILIFLLFVYFTLNHLLVYVYVCPYIYTDGFKYVAKPVKLMTEIISETERSMAAKGLDVKIIYQNAYGSGFLKNNPVPNDLDYMVGVNLGEYDYNGRNVDEIAHKLTEKICTFEPVFIYYADTVSKSDLYSAKSYSEALFMQPRGKVYNCIRDSLDRAVQGERYVKDTLKLIPINNIPKVVHIPYMMRPNEILLDSYDSIELYAKNISYHKHTPQYLRELMVVFEYTFTINQNGKKTEILVVPESSFGARLQLARKFFVSNTFVTANSVNFIKNYPPIKDDEEYFFYRIFSFRRHLLEVENIISQEDRPLKILKRIMQTADSIEPMLDKDLYKEIGAFVNKYLSERKNVLLNEAANIIGLYWDISQYPYLYSNLQNSEELKTMYITLTATLEEMEKIGLDKKFLLDMREYQEVCMKPILIGAKYDRVELDSATGEIKEKIYALFAKDFLHQEALTRYISAFHKIFTDAGYHKVTAYWLDEKTMGLISNEFTKGIDDFKRFAQENDLPMTEYKLISPNDVIFAKMRHDMWVRYNATEEENRNFIILKQTLLKDKKNFGLKFKFVRV